MSTTEKESLGKLEVSLIGEGRDGTLEFRWYEGAVPYVSTVSVDDWMQGSHEVFELVADAIKRSIYLSV